MEQVEQITEMTCTPRRFWEIPLLWLTFWKMDYQFFQNERSHVDILNTMFGFELLAVILPIIQWVDLEIGQFTGPNGSLFTSFIFEPNTGEFIPRMYFKGLYLLPIIIYLLNIFYFILAKLFGGKGNFSTQAYFFCLSILPIYFVFELSLFLSSFRELVLMYAVFLFWD